MSKQNQIRLIDTENRLTAVRREGMVGRAEKSKGIKGKKTHRHRQQYGDYRGKGEWGRQKRVKEVNGERKRFDFGG